MHALDCYLIFYLCPKTNITLLLKISPNFFSFLFWVLKKITGLYLFECLLFFVWLLTKHEEKKIEEMYGK